MMRRWRSQARRPRRERLAAFGELVAISHPQDARVNAAAILAAIGGILTLQSITSYLVAGSTVVSYGPATPSFLTTVLVTLLPVPMFLIAWQVYHLPQRRLWLVGLPAVITFVAAGGAALTITHDDTGGAQLMLALGVLYCGYQLRPVGAWLGTAAVMIAAAVITLSVSPGSIALLNISLLWATFMALTYAAIAARRTQESSTRRLRALAETDSLTGLATRSVLGRRARLALENPDRRGTALLILDIDFLKALNDDRGHVAGDALIRHVAQLTATSIRPADTASRLGGDEIAVLMPSLTSEEAHSRSAALFEKISSSRARLPDGTDIQVRLSAGLGHVRSSGPLTQSQLYAVADRALYRAKRQGRGGLCAEAVLLQALPDEVTTPSGSTRCHHGP